MLISKISREEIPGLTLDQAEKIVFGGERFDDPSAEVALLLGTEPGKCDERARMAAKLYRESKVKYIVPSGGVEWEYEGRMVSEAEYMAQILSLEGVPDEAIILEKEARTTKENMIYGTLQINRKINFYKVRRVCIVTSSFHVRRSVELARVFLPKTVEVVGCGANELCKNWRGTPEALEFVLREIPLIKSLVDNKMMSDVEF